MAHDHTGNICGNRVTIVVAGILFLFIFMANIVLLAFYWPKDHTNTTEQIQKERIQWFPYVVVLMIGIICTALYVVFYQRCDATAAVLVLALPVLANIATVMKWPAYSLNPLAFGYYFGTTQSNINNKNK